MKELLLLKKQRKICGWGLPLMLGSINWKLVIQEAKYFLFGIREEY